jgi:hypothetical protein
MVGFRVIVLPGNEKPMTRLCTNLPRSPFSLDLVASLARPDDSGPVSLLSEGEPRVITYDAALAKRTSRVAPRGRRRDQALG